MEGSASAGPFFLVASTPVTAWRYVHLTVRTLSVTMNPHDIFRLPAVNATGLRYAFFLCLHHLAAPEWNIGVSHACVPPRKEMVVTKKDGPIRSYVLNSL